MTVYEYMISEYSHGVERELLKRIIPTIDTEKKLLAVTNSSVLKSAVLKLYPLFAKIEDLPEAEKKDLKSFVITRCPNRPVSELVAICKVIYTIGCLT